MSEYHRPPAGLQEIHLQYDVILLQLLLALYALQEAWSVTLVALLCAVLLLSCRATIVVAQCDSNGIAARRSRVGD
jgi:hypothetical protein